VADGTAGNQVQSAVAPVVVRPNNATSGVMSNTTAAISAANDTNNGRVTMQMILQAKATMSTNAVPKAGATGNYIYYADPLQLTGLYQDPAFQRFFIGKPDSAEYRKGIVAELLECNIVETNMAPVQTLSGAVIHRGILCGQGALVEGVFTRAAMAEAAKVDDASGMLTVIDDIAHITREPIDALKQVVTQHGAISAGLWRRPTSPPTRRRSRPRTTWH